MSIHKLVEMTWVEVEQLDKQTSVVILPLSPVEEHGPHLPLGTDLFGAADMAEWAARRIEDQELGYHIVLAPAIPLGCTAVTADFPGTISLRGQTLYHVVQDVCTALTEAGFIYLAITNHHLDSVHMKAILSAAEQVASRTGAHILETASCLHYTGLKTEEDETGTKMGLDMEKEIHAEVRETSYISYRYPHLVKGDVSKMDSVFINVREEAKKGRRSFKEMGARQGYIGSPQHATEAFGRLHLEDGSRLIADLILKLLQGKPLPEIHPAIRKFLEKHVMLD